MSLGDGPDMTNQPNKPLKLRNYPKASPLSRGKVGWAEKIKKKRLDGGNIVNKLYFPIHIRFRFPSLQSVNRPVCFRTQRSTWGTSLAHGRARQEINIRQEGICPAPTPLRNTFEASTLTPPPYSSTNLQPMQSTHRFYCKSFLAPLRYQIY